jgi:ferritin
MERFKNTILSDGELKELNKFGKMELTASQVYIHLANRMKTLGFFGAEKFFMDESNGERDHYRKIAEFANDLGAELSTESLEAINCDCQDIRSALEMAYKMEKDLLLSYESAAKKSEMSLKVVLLLQDFTTHQVGAVGEYGDLLARIALTDNMLLFDQELGK